MKDKVELNEQKGNAVDTVKPKKKKKWLMVVIAVVVIVAIIIVMAVRSMTQTVEMVANTVEVEPVQLRDLSDTISLKGSIAGASSTNVMSTAVAEITSMNVQVGDVVQEGDVLCTLDSESIQETLSNAQAVDSINDEQMNKTLEQAIADQQTQLAEAQKSLEDAQGSFNYVEMQYEAGEIPYESYWSSKRALESAESSYANILEQTNRTIDSAKTQIELDKYSSGTSSTDALEDMREQLADCEVKAPCSGVVTSVNMRVGDINTAKTTIITIEDTSSLKVVATVDEADILKLQEGMKAEVTADATGDEKINGTVSRVVRVKSQGTGADAATAGGYSVEVTIDNNELLIGMAAKAKIMLKEKGEVLAVPYDLIQYDEDGSAFVLVAVSNEDGSATAVRKNIEVGEEVDYYTEIVGGDLAEGDMLIYDYTFSVVEGQSFAPEQMYSNQELGIEIGAEQSETSDDVEVME